MLDSLRGVDAGPRGTWVGRSGQKGRSYDAERGASQGSKLRVAGCSVLPPRSENHRQAVLELLGGEITVDRVARRRWARHDTVVGWRLEAIEGICHRLGDAARFGQTPR